MPRKMRCININGGYHGELTIGKIYEILREYPSPISGTPFVALNSDNGTPVNCRQDRFIEVANLPIGTKLRVKSDLRIGSANPYGRYELDAADEMIEFRGAECKITRYKYEDRGWFGINIDNDEWQWCEEMFDIISIPETPTAQVTIPVEPPIYFPTLGEPTIISNTRPRPMPSPTLDRLLHTNYAAGLSPSYTIIDEYATLTDEPVEETPIPTATVIPEYAHVTSDLPIKKYSKILLPTRSTRFSDNKLGKVDAIRKALENGRDFIYVTYLSTYEQTFVGYTKTQLSGNFNVQDLEAYTTKFVEGVLENGHRIKDDCGKTHTFEDFNLAAYEAGANLTQTLIDNNDDYITYIDSSGWYIRKWKELVTKPRGTVRYTEYKAMCPESYALYKANQEQRNAFLNATITLYDETEGRAAILEAERQRAEQEARRIAEEERERIEAERIRIYEEEERKFQELNKNGIWKHHIK